MWGGLGVRLAAARFFVLFHEDYRCQNASREDAYDHYRQRSEEVLKTPALIARYRPEHSKGSGKDGVFKDPRCLFADRELMTSITSDDRQKFISSYHWHFDELACQGKPIDEAES